MPVFERPSAALDHDTGERHIAGPSYSIVVGLN
jgi:hypothetical protein